ncbi:uncharacterized protein LOC112271067 [Brachypodium distachyon]|nr:uncharacterized protein LOC112271067 [Brachypodium distachyon]|eukprot:XP_024315742.1 uncharacterized protein LOC112271067 [Brachypodium distachyon]
MGSSHGWLITADEQSNLIFVNPATLAQIAMPPPETMRNVRLRYNAEGELDGYDLLYMDLSSRDFDTKTEPDDDLSLEEGRFYFYVRVAISCDPSSGNCIVLRVHLPGYQLSYARVGDTAWTWIDTDTECWDYHGIIHSGHDGLFYALRGNGTVHSIDLNGPSPVVKVILKQMVPYINSNKYIARAPWGDFYQIWRHDDFSAEKDGKVTSKNFVYKIDFVGQKLVQVNSLRDHALFIGFNSPFFVPVKDFCMLIPNSIYYTDDLHYYIFCHRISLREVVVFNMEDNSFTDLSLPNSRLNGPPPVWIRPSLT